MWKGLGRGREQEVKPRGCPAPAPAPWAPLTLPSSAGGPKPPTTAPLHAQGWGCGAHLADEQKEPAPSVTADRGFVPQPSRDLPAPT